MTSIIPGGWQTVVWSICNGKVGIQPHHPAFLAQPWGWGQQAAEEARLEGRIAEAVEAARREAERELRAAREADHLAVEAERARALHRGASRRR